MKVFLKKLPYLFFLSVLINISMLFSNGYSLEKNVVSFPEKKEIKKYKYVIFDVSNCFWQKSLYDLLMSLRKNIKIPFKGYLDLLQCGVSYAFGTLDAKKGYETFFKYFEKMKESDIKEMCNAVWEKDCKKFIYKDAFEKFEQHKNDGSIIIFVDAGIPQLYEELKKIYNCDYLFSSKLEFFDGISTGKLSGDPCSGKYKYEWVKKLIEDDLNGSLQDVIFYANSHNDIPLLEKVGKPIAVNPNSKLRSEAKKRKWEILNFSELKKN